jgi:hypothetical protein
MTGITEFVFGLAFLAFITALIVVVAVVLGHRENQESTPEVDEWVRNTVRRAS